MRRKVRWPVVFIGIALMGCNQNPNSVKLTPSINQVKSEGNIRLNATSGNLQVSKVEFFKGSTKIGEDTSAPFDQDVAIALADNGPQVFNAKYSLANGKTEIATTAVSVNIASIDGTVSQTPRTGANPINGVLVTLKHGNQNSSTSTGPTGRFSIPLTDNGTDTFTLTVVPPTGTPYVPSTLDDIPLAAYASEYSAAKEINLLLSGGPAVALPAYAPRWGCVAGKVFDGESAVVGSGPASAPVRTSPATCDGSAPAGLSTDPPTGLRLGEKGLVLYRGFQAVSTRQDGSYLMPAISTNNGFATEGSLWAGNYTGTDEAGLEEYWSKFAYVPQAKVFLNKGQTNTAPDMHLEAFDPSTNPTKVVGVPMMHTTKDLEARGFIFSGETADSFSYTDVLFSNAITSGDIALGSYYDFTQPHTIRAYKIPAGKEAQQIAFNNTALKFDAAGNVAAFSEVQQWLDGTTINRSLNAFFMPVAGLNLPANNAENVSRAPTLSWDSVWENKVYFVTVYDGTTGKPVWEIATPHTSVTLPMNLAADADYLWDVATYEQYDIGDVVGVSREAMQANRHLDMSRLMTHAPKKNMRESVINHWRGELASSFVSAFGSVPQTDLRAFQLLKWRDWRISASETFAFRTMK